MDLFSRSLAQLTEHMIWLLQVTNNCGGMASWHSTKSLSLSHYSSCKRIGVHKMFMAVCKDEVIFTIAFIIFLYSA